MSINLLPDVTTSHASLRSATNHVAADPLQSSFAVDQILFHMRDALVVADVCSGALCAAIRTRGVR